MHMGVSTNACINDLVLLYLHSNALRVWCVRAAPYRVLYAFRTPRKRSESIVLLWVTSKYHVVFNCPHSCQVSPSLVLMVVLWFFHGPHGCSWSQGQMTMGTPDMLIL